MENNELGTHPTVVPTLPSEILLDIIGLLRHSKESLLSCSLVNHFFHRISEQVLVSCLNFAYLDESLASLKSFSFLEAHPSLAQYIHCLTLDAEALASLDYSSVIADLDNLRILHLIGCAIQGEWPTFMPWSFVSRSSASLIWLQRHLPHITNLTLSDWIHFPVSFLSSCTNLRHLQLHRIIFNNESDKTDDEEDPSVVVKSPLTLDSLSLIEVYFSPLLIRLFEDPQVTVKSLSLYLGLAPDEDEYLLVTLLQGRFELLTIICSRNQDTLRSLTFTGPMAMITRSPTFFPSAFSNLRSYRIPISICTGWDVDFVAQLCLELKRGSHGALDLFIDTDDPHVVFRSFPIRALGPVPSWEVFDRSVEDVVAHRPFSVVVTAPQPSDSVKLYFWESTVKEVLMPKTYALGVLRFEYRKTPPCC